MLCSRPGCVLWLGHDPPCIDGQCNEISAEDVASAAAAAPAASEVSTAEVILRNREGYPNVIFRLTRQAAEARLRADGNIPNGTCVRLMEWDPKGHSHTAGFACIFWHGQGVYVRQAHIIMERTPPASLHWVAAEADRIWEVLTDKGWLVWRPGVPFKGVMGEEIAFTMIPNEGHAGFPMTARFDSAASGIQTNLHTGRQRQLRLAQRQAGPALSALPHDFDTRVKQKACLQDFQEPLGSDETILTYLLRTQCISLVSGKWLVQQFKLAQRLPRRQDLPAEAFVSTEALFESRRGPCYNLGDGAILVVAMSYGWCRRGHPDPDCFHLRALGHLLEVFFQCYDDVFNDVAVFWDWLSLFQIFGNDGQIVGRTPEEESRFKAALDFMHVIYGHIDILTWRFQCLPEGVTPQTPDRGWPCFEEAIFSTAKKHEIQICSEGYQLGQKLRPTMMLYDNEALLAQKTLDDIFKLRENKFTVPMPPESFIQVLSRKIFTGKGDQVKITKLYAETFEESFALIDSFPWLETTQAWTAGEGRDLAIAFQKFDRVKTLTMENCGIQDFALFFENFGSESLEDWSLRSNNIGASVRQLFSTALPRMTRLKRLFLGNANIKEPDFDGLTTAGSSSLEYLSFGRGGRGWEVRFENKFGAGVSQLFLAVLPRLTNLKELDLNSVVLGEFAFDRFKRDGGGAVLAALERLELSDCDLSSRGTQQVFEMLSRFPVLHSLQIYAPKSDCITKLSDCADALSFSLQELELMGAWEMKGAGKLAEMLSRFPQLRQFRAFRWSHQDVRKFKLQMRHRGVQVFTE